MTKRKPALYICGPIAGGRGYFEFEEHAKQKRNRKACDPVCFFCERDRHPERYACVNGVWKDKP